MDEGYLGPPNAGPRSLVDQPDAGGAERLERLLCLFELDFADAADMRPELAGRPVYLAMAMDREFRLKLKPQNLLLNLPLARPQ